MWGKFFIKWITNFLILGVGLGIFVVPLLLSINQLALIPFVFIIMVIAACQSANHVNKEIKKKCQEEAKQREQAQKETKLWKASLIEKNAGFPTLLKAIEQYETIKDEKVEQYLRYKSHPSRKGAEVVREEAHRRRQAEYENKTTKAIIEYYESIAPFLIEFKNDIIDIDDEEKYREYDEEERLDPAIYYLTKEEFRKLPSQERNQMALDRFWKRPKSKWLIGRIYERYVGYLYEEQGYDVEYVGIFKGYEDLGRDLICQKGKDFIVIQCKNWAEFRTIYEKHIFQFFGTVFQYRDKNPDRKVRAFFYTSTELSKLARRFSNELGIELKEKFKFDKDYPSIKCHTSKIDGTKIYHLPFDQQYDKTKLEKKYGEFYCKTVKEAEDAGFRRAFTYRPTRQQ
jgi:hypothetical protein